MAIARALPASREFDAREGYPASVELLVRAQRVIPGGHHLSGRPLLTPNLSPMYMERGKGCRVWDVDGNSYLDYIGAYGPCILGYAHPVVEARARAQLERGSLLSLNHPLHVEFAERLVSLVPRAEMALFVKTGSEATTAALRIARRATGRRKVIRWGYHGWHDWCLANESWVPEGLDEQVFELGNAPSRSLQEAFRAHPKDIAAVIIAPEMVLPYDREVFVELIELTRRNGAVFILDEIKTGIRIKPGTFQEFAEITPDLTTLSKALGNGWPVAAVVGSRAVLEHAAGLHVSATFHGETAAMAAAMATFDVVEAERVAEHVWQLGQALIDGMNALCSHYEVPASAFGEPLPPMPFFKFTHEDQQLNDQLSQAFYATLYRLGVLMHPRHMWFISHAHQARDIEVTLATVEAGLQNLVAEFGGRL